jgi:apolipoprotein N-acyltransferase
MKPATKIALTPLLLALASGVLFAFSLPPFDYEFLGWFALVPLLVAAAKQPKPLYTVGLGMITGLFCGVLHVGWNANTSALHFAYLPFVWLALVIGIVAAFGTAGYDRWGDNGKRLLWPLWVACAGVLVEWLTTFSPLPVGIALCQYRNVYGIQIASVTGIWGVSFPLWFANAALADAFLTRKKFTLPVGIAAGVVLVAHAFGAWVVSAGSSSSGVRHRVAAVQDYNGVEASGIGGPEVPNDAPDRDALTHEAARRGAKLIVQTEEALGAAFTPNDPDDQTNQLAQEIKAYLVVGCEERAEPMPFNSAVLIGPDGKAKGTHHKLHLFLGERQKIQPGGGVSAFNTNLGRVGLLICFDSCYTTPTRQAVQAGAQVIAMPNYDPPTPRAVLHDLHAALIPFRAVENRVAYVRADPNGRSQIIDPWGRIVAETGFYKPEALVAEVLFGSGQGTLFTRWGDWLAYLCIVGMVGMIAGRRKNKICVVPVSPGC